MRISVKKAMQEELLVECVKRVDPETGFDPSPEVVVLDSSRDWLLMRNVDAFDLDGGYLVTARKIIRFLRSSIFTNFRRRVLRAEKVWPQIKASPAIDLKNAAAILRSLHQQSAFVIILCEVYSNWRRTHCRIERVLEDQVWVRCFNGAGEWERSSLCLELAEITQIRFGSRYLKYYEKYARRFPKAMRQ